MKGSTLNKIAFVLLMICATSSTAQKNDLFELWPDTTLAQANSASEVDYMNEEEKKVIFYINLCRKNPKVFSETYLKDYLKVNKVKKDRNVKDLIEVLETTASRKMLEPSELLTNVAREHAKDMGATGRTGHSTSDGTSFKDRMKKASGEFAGLNENANYGNDQAFDIVVDLLIDKNVPSAGHRRNILDSDSRYIGVAIEPHKRFGVNCVQVFGGKRIGS